MKKQQLWAVMAAFAVAALPARSEESSPWQTDFEAAKKAAAEQKKDLFINFTGSDWCVACIQLDEAVLSKQDFLDKAQEKYVLVKLDFPERTELEAAQREQNEKLAEEFGIEAFPSFFYLDSEGRPYASVVGGAEDNVEAYLEHMKEQSEIRVERDAAFEAAETLEGVEKSKALVAALKKLPESALTNYYQAQLDEVKKNDPSDETGFTRHLEGSKALVELEGELEALFHDEKYEEIATKVDEFISKYRPEGDLFQAALFPKLAVLAQTGEFEKALEVVEEIIKADPKSEYGEFAVQVKEQLQEELKASKEAGDGEASEGADAAEGGEGEAMEEGAEKEEKAAE